MYFKTAQKLYHLLDYYNSCCCSVQSEQLMTIQDLRLKLSGAALKYP